MQLLRSLTLSVLLLPATVGPLVAEDATGPTIQAGAAVGVDADGRPTQIDVLGQLPPGLTQFLRDNIARWEFVPGTLNQQPVPSTTNVWVTLAKRKIDGGDKVEFVIVAASTGPRYQAAKPPRYPAAALARRQSGEVVLKVDFDRSGAATAVSVERSNAGRILATAAVAAVKGWTFAPETVGGHSIGATVLVPISFCIESRSCARLESIRDRDQLQLVGEPAVRLKTAVAAM